MRSIIFSWNENNFLSVINMAYVRKAKRTSRSKRTRRSYRRRYSRAGYRSLNRRINSLNRRIAGEVCKFESTPELFRNYSVTVVQSGTNYVYNLTPNQPLLNITSGNAYIYPLNWWYTAQTSTVSGAVVLWVNGEQFYVPNAIAPPFDTISVRQPLYYNTFDPAQQLGSQEDFRGTEYQYRLKYIYINALFNASLATSTTNLDGAVRFVIVKDKQPTGGSATWYEESSLSSNNINKRGVFNANRIDAQLNPQTVGRYKIMYDKTLRFNTINGYKPFKYYKRLSSIVRNNRDIANNYLYNSNTSYYQTNDQATVIQRNAYYLMIFSDGLNFTYTTDSTTGPGEFHLFNRIAYYNN